MAHYQRRNKDNGGLPPLVKTTVVVTNWNYGYYLDRCVRSLVNQTDDNYEILVVDDNSNDYSHDILDLWRDEPNIRILRNRTNLGLGKSCNRAIRSSKARYVVRVDADDFVGTEYIYMLSRFLDHNPTVDAVACDYFTVDRDAKEHYMDAIEHPIACGIMYRKEVLWEVGMYSESREVREDIEIMERFKIGGYRLGHLAVPLYRYRQHSDSLTDWHNERKRSESVETEEESNSG